MGLQSLGQYHINGGKSYLSGLNFQQRQHDDKTDSDSLVAVNRTLRSNITYNYFLRTLWQQFGEDFQHGCDVKCSQNFGQRVYNYSKIAACNLVLICDSCIQCLSTEFKI